MLVAALIGLGMLGGAAGAALAEIGATHHQTQHARDIDDVGLRGHH